MNKYTTAAILAACLVGPAWAVYAPVPEEELGQKLTAKLTAGIFHDSNIFGASTGAIDSMVYRLSPSFALNTSLTDQTFFSASYALTYDYVEDRPSNTDLISHAVSARLAHSFSQRSNIDITETFSIVESPESLLAGIPLNADQSFKSNQFDGRYVTGLTEQLSLTLKGRSVILRYDTPALASALDRNEVLLGAVVDLEVSPITKIAGEYRFQDVSYETAGNLKDKQSNFLLGGFDMTPSQQSTFSLRGGMEFRSRDGAPDTDSPYVEVTGRYAYSEKSYLSGGYILTFEEVSNIARYTDIQVNRLFLNVEHALTAKLTGSMMYTVEPSELKARPGTGPNAEETTQRLGLALTFRPNRQTTIAAQFDVDNTASDDPARDLQRTRIGIDIRYTF